ncbi:unnamed protein product [Gadus morhua 'NCC']
MDLHRPFKMDSPSYLPPPLASPALMVLASTAEAGRDASVPCQAPRPFGVPVSMSEKDLHLPFPSASYTFTSMYHHHHHHRQGGGGGGGGGGGPVSGSFAARDFPASLLHHLHPHFNPPGLDCSPLGMLNHGGLQGAFRPFSSPHEDRDLGAYHSAFTPAKRLKGSFGEVEGKEFGDFGSPGVGSLKAGEESAGRKLFSMSGLLSDREASSSPEELQERSPSLLFRKASPTAAPVILSGPLSGTREINVCPNPTNPPSSSNPSLGPQHIPAGQG